MPRRKMSRADASETDSVREELGSRIALFRRKAGLTQEQLAAVMDIGRNSVANWEGGRAFPDVGNIPSVCRALGITASELFGDAPEMSAAERKLLSDFRLLGKAHRCQLLTLSSMMAEEETHRSTVEERECPQLIALPHVLRQLAAGVDYPMDTESESEPVYVYRTPLTEKADCLFDVSGDSMEPGFPDGCTVAVRKTSGRLRPGAVGAFLVGNEFYIKQYEKDGLHSLNPAYPPMHFSETAQVTLIGEVLGILPAESRAEADEISLWLESQPS